MVGRIRWGVVRVVAVDAVKVAVAVVVVVGGSWFDCCCGSGW